jgi:site-specific DNA-methyltransferase (adenine-specific)/modification methylase
MVDKVVIGNATLYHGDCLEILPTLPKVDAVITDPPYGIGLGATAGTGGGHGLQIAAYESHHDSYANFVAYVVPRINACLDASERACVFTGPHIHEQRKPDAIGGVFCPAASARHLWGFKSFLPALLYGTAPDLHRGSKQTAIRSTETKDDNGHPCPKPDGWMRWAVDLTTRRAETVLDPFMGSGTTGVACVQLGRQFIGIEIERKYFDIACERIENAQRQETLFHTEPQTTVRHDDLLSTR